MARAAFARYNIILYTYNIYIFKIDSFTNPIRYNNDNNIIIEI